MVALVTGSHGFIGSKLCEALIQEDIQVIQLNREWLLSPDLGEYLKKIHIDYVFHCAAYGNMRFQKDSVQIVNANIIGTFNLLYALPPVKACVLLGSSSEYGTGHTVMKESTLPRPQSFYAASKIAATALGQVFAKENPVVTVRPFSVYGEGEAEFRFIPSIIRAKQLHEPFTLTEDIRHDWIHVNDFITGVLIVAKYADKLRGQIVNLGTGRETYNSQILKHVWPRYEGKLPKKDKGHWKADITLANSLGWTPKISLEEGLDRVYAHYTK